MARLSAPRLDESAWMGQRPWPSSPNGDYNLADWLRLNTLIVADQRKTIDAQAALITALIARVAALETRPASTTSSTTTTSTTSTAPQTIKTARWGTHLKLVTPAATAGQPDRVAYVWVDSDGAASLMGNTHWECPTGNVADGRWVADDPARPCSRIMGDSRGDLHVYRYPAGAHPDGPAIFALKIGSAGETRVWNPSGKGLVVDP